MSHSLPKTLREFVIKHRIQLGCAYKANGERDFYYAPTVNGLIVTRYMTANAKPKVSHAMALMRRYLKDHGR